MTGSERPLATLDYTFRALSDRLRRCVLVTLNREYAAAETVEIETLVAEVIEMTETTETTETTEAAEVSETAEATEPTGTTEDDAAATAEQLYHVHLPWLDETGFLDWDREREVVSRGPRFGAATPVLELLDRNRSELPARWP